MKKTLSFRMIYNRSFSCFENIFDHFFLFSRVKYLNQTMSISMVVFFWGGGGGGLIFFGQRCF